MLAIEINTKFLSWDSFFSFHISSTENGKMSGTLRRELLRLSGLEPPQLALGRFLPRPERLCLSNRSQSQSLAAQLASEPT